MDMQKHALNLGASYINRTVPLGRIESLQKYFKIDNSYLFRKLLLIIYPYKGSLWMHFTDRDIPSVSIGHPDLYIPLMAIITYILCTACELEIQEKFRPEELGKITTKSVLLALLETAVIKAASFFFESISLNIPDILSFIGYKYVTVITMKIFAIILPIFFSKLSTIFLGLSFAIFLGKSLKYFLISSEHEIAIKKRKMYFLFSIILLECILLLILK